MEAYKLFQILHKRTDYFGWNGIYDFARRALLPEEYTERERQAHQSLLTLTTALGFLSAHTKSGMSWFNHGIGFDDDDWD